MRSGWVAISRQIMDSPDLRTPAERWAMVWMVIHAAVKPMTVRASKAPVQIGRGQLTHSTRHLAEEWGMSEAGVRRLLKRLEERRTIRRERDAEGDAGQCVITLCNYDQFQITSRDVTQRRRSGDAAATQRETGEQDNRIDSPPTPPAGGGTAKRKRSKKDDDGYRSPEFLAAKARYPESAHEDDFLDWKAWLYLTDDGREAAGVAVTSEQFTDDMAGREPRYVPRMANWLREGGFWKYVERNDEQVSDEGRRRSDGLRREDGLFDGGDLPGGRDSVHESAGRPVSCPRQSERSGSACHGGVAQLLANAGAALARASDPGCARWRGGLDDVDRARAMAERDDGPEHGRPAWH